MIPSVARPWTSWATAPWLVWLRVLRATTSWLPRLRASHACDGSITGSSDIGLFLEKSLSILLCPSSIELFQKSFESRSSVRIVRSQRSGTWLTRVGTMCLSLSVFDFGCVSSSGLNKGVFKNGGEVHLLVYSHPLVHGGKRNASLSQRANTPSLAMPSSLFCWTSSHNSGSSISIVLSKTNPEFHTLSACDWLKRSFGSVILVLSVNIVPKRPTLWFLLGFDIILIDFVILARSHDERFCHCSIQMYIILSVWGETIILCLGHRLKHVNPVKMT